MHHNFKYIAIFIRCVTTSLEICASNGEETSEIFDYSPDPRTVSTSFFVLVHKSVLFGRHGCLWIRNFHAHDVFLLRSDFLRIISLHGSFLLRRKSDQMVSQSFPSPLNSYSLIKNTDLHMIILLHRNIHIPTADYKYMRNTTTTTSIAHLSVQCVHRIHNAGNAFRWPLCAKTRTLNEIEEKSDIKNIKKNVNTSIAYLCVPTNSKKCRTLQRFFCVGRQSI